MNLIPVGSRAGGITKMFTDLGLNFETFVIILLSSGLFLCFTKLPETGRSAGFAEQAKTEKK